MEALSPMLHTEYGVYLVYVVSQIIGIVFISKYYTKMYGDGGRFRIEKYLMVCLFLFASIPDSISHEIVSLIQEIIHILFT